MTSLPVEMLLPCSVLVRLICPNQLTANQNMHALRLGSILGLVSGVQESAKIDLRVVPKDLCFGAPRLVWIDEHPSLEVQSWDCRRSLGLGSSSELFF